MFVPPSVEGEKHPAGRGLSDRLVRAQHAILKDTTRKLGGGNEDWPVIVTRVSPDRAEMLAQLHRLCDWVITIDRHAGVEYFDSPRELPLQYESFLIDCVPERDDLGFLQLITTTSSLDEVFRLLDTALSEMGLSTSPRNCGYLLDALKAVSGRLALRLSQSGTVAQELVALALTYRQCAAAADGAGPWLPLTEGFFVPLDDVPELFRPVGDRREHEDGGRRADLLYVSCGRRGGLKFSFVEVKFRRYLKTARTPDLLESIAAQLAASVVRWEQLFGAASGSLEKTVQRGRLARVLRFYAKKGCRHALSPEANERIEKELLRLTREGAEYPLPTLFDQERPKVGFVFCPEYSGPPTDVGGDIWLFGPAALPEDRLRASPPAVPDAAADGSLGESAFAAQRATSVILSVESEDRERSSAAVLCLGIREGSEEDVSWPVSVAGNPHMLMVGLPGMGKTTCLLSLCEQFTVAGVAPIVFSYHEDIDAKLKGSLDGNIQTVSYSGLGFNPLEVSSQSPLAYMDNVSMLRDIFAAVFPDLGEIQLGRLREAIKQSYIDNGWATGVRGQQPEFSSFYEILKAEPKPDKGLMTRLAELADYGFFASESGAPSLLDSKRPVLVQVHATQNEVMQRAFAVFVLHNLYQSMFRRGVQAKITHAIIFDEAHRAAKLRLIPTMAKECRKFGISFVVASQEAKDFDQSMFTAIANYLALRVGESDAKVMARIMAPSDKVSLYADRIKQTAKFKAWFYAEGMRQPILVGLKADR
jgi:DNA phosphorothioation-dependent restriction protein DptH